MIYQENQIRQFQTVFGYNLLSEIEFFVAEPFLLVTMEDLWQKYESKFNINSEYLYFVNSLEIKDLDDPGIINNSSTATTSASKPLLKISSPELTKTEVCSWPLWVTTFSSEYLLSIAGLNNNVLLC